VSFVPRHFPTNAFALKAEIKTCLIPGDVTQNRMEKLHTREVWSSVPDVLSF
jgi:hypothetical protein